MKSPFPGMDPYLERRWSGIHGRLINYAADALNDGLDGSPLRAEVEERLVVDLVEGAYDAYPDLSVLEGPAAGRPLPVPSADAATVTLARPLLVPTPTARPQRSISIAHAGSGKVITTLEFVSPSNKTSGKTRRQFLRKRRDSLDAGINIVEIDLTRAGRRHLPDALSARPEAAAVYLAFARRESPTPRYEVYPLALRDPLPTIAIPLRPGDADLPLALQPLVDTAHARSRFRPSDYAGPLRPPLPPDDAAWAEAMLAGAGIDLAIGAR